MKTHMRFEQLAPVLPVQIRDAASKAGITDDAEVKRAPFVKVPVDLPEGSRLAVQYVSTREPDMDGEIIIQEGIDFSGFMKNPVVFYGHDYASPPIGTDENIGLDANGWGTLAHTRYSETEPGATIFKLKQEGILRGSSIGFIRREAVRRGEKGWKEVTEKLAGAWKTSPEFDGVNTITTSAFLLEHSDCGIGCNPDALTVAVAKKLDSAVVRSLGLAKDEPRKPEVVEEQEHVTAKITRIVPVVRRLARVEYIPRPVNVAAIVREELARARGRV